ncbi:3D domain-containing protein [Cohnella panacarvi]|uniref:3D domain-containing protein n=1 Tax=Cohnella panacarvi TaxID=400776 RepID=UPI00047BF600|nr:3D domain-containing protein [Cohnella panacarvi]
MGEVPVQDSHDPRPTGKLIALLRWKHEHMRIVLLSAILLFAVLTMFMSLLHPAEAKSISIVDNGVTSVIQTRSSDIQDVLEEQQIRVGPYDRLSMTTGDQLTNGSTIVIDRAKGVTVKADGKEAVKYTAADSVEAAIKELNLSIGSEDRVSPALNAPVTEGMEVVITRVRTEVVESSQAVAFQVVEQKNADLAEGKTKVVKTGQEGQVVVRTAKVYEDGKLVGERVLEKTVSKPAVHQVVAIGTKKAEVKTLTYNGKPTEAEAKIVQLNGKSVKVKRMLSNVTLTAYSADFASTGKRKGDKGYGITSSGAVVEEGRTIAVDPKVIPIGWWVYIEGIGFRRAEDTGSAVKGKKIDIYYDSEKYADRFGKKKGYTVYVIGPVKPSAN